MALLERAAPAPTQVEMLLALGEMEAQGHVARQYRWYQDYWLIQYPDGWAVFRPDGARLEWEGQAFFEDYEMAQALVNWDLKN